MEGSHQTNWYAYVKNNNNNKASSINNSDIISNFSFERIERSVKFLKFQNTLQVDAIIACSNGVIYSHSSFFNKNHLFSNPINAEDISVLEMSKILFFFYTGMAFFDNMEEYSKVNALFGRFGLKKEEIIIISYFEDSRMIKATNLALKGFGMKLIWENKEGVMLNVNLMGDSFPVERDYLDISSCSSNTSTEDSENLSDESEIEFIDLIVNSLKSPIEVVTLDDTGDEVEIFSPSKINDITTASASDDEITIIPVSPKIIELVDLSID